MSLTRLCRDSSRESERNGSVYTKAKGQISLAKGFMHKDAKSLSLKLASTSLAQKEHWLLNGKGKQGNELETISSENEENGGAANVSGRNSMSSEEKVAATMNKKMSSSAPGPTLSEKSVHDKIDFSLHLPMSSSSHSTDSSDATHYSLDHESLKWTDSGFPDEQDDSNKMADKKAKAKKKKNVTKKAVICTNDNDGECHEDVNGNPVNSSEQSQSSSNHPDVAQIYSLQKEMGKELANNQALKPADSQEAPGGQRAAKSKKRAGARYILAEDIPDYRGRDKIEDILKFIGKNPSNDSLNRSLERKKKNSKRKGLNGHVLRSDIMDENPELSDSDTTNFCPTKLPNFCPTKSPSFPDKAFRNCDTSDDSCVADDSFVSSPGKNSAPPSAEPFILVEKKNKKKVYANSSSSSSGSNHNARPGKYFSSKSPFRNRKLNSAMAHQHHTHNQFNCDDDDPTDEQDSSYPDLESSYHNVRRNSTGNVIMSMSMAVQNITLEDSDNESWKSLPISQGADLINEKCYPVSYAKIAASSLPSNPTTGNSSVISANDDGVGGGSCSSGSGGSTSGDAAIEEKNVDEESDAHAKDGNSSVDSGHCKIGYTQSESDKSTKYLLRDKYNSCGNPGSMNRRHSIGECVGSPDAEIDSVVDTKYEISRSQHLLGTEDRGGSSDINADSPISFCDRKSATSVEELGSKLSLKDSSASSSMETLTPTTADAETKTPGDSQVVSSSGTSDDTQLQSCSSSSISSHSGVSDDAATAVKFINPRDRRHDDKQFTITFGFFCDTDAARNNPPGSEGEEIEIQTPSDNSLPSSLPPPPSSSSQCPPTSPEMLAVPPPLQQDLENSNGATASATKESEGGGEQPVSSSQSTDFVTGGSKKDINNKAATANNTTTGSTSSHSFSSSSSAPVVGGATCDLVKKDVKPVDVDIKSASKLNGLVLPFADKTCLTPSSSVTTTPAEQALITTTSTTAINISTTTTTNTTSTTKKSTTSPAITKTIDTTVSPSNSISGAACDSQQQETLACSTSVTDDSTGASASSSVNNKNNHTNNNNNNNSASAAVDNAAEAKVLKDLGLIPLSYGNKIKADTTKKVIHFRSDEADAQLFNQEEVLSYLSKEYHRVCQLSGPSTIVRVGTE